jgi:tRNA(fMet)-specific endonuclease VapC
MSRYLLDTNAFSHAIRGTFPDFNRRFESTSLADIGISVVSEAELLFGLARRPQARTLALTVTSLLKKIVILPWTSPAAKAYAELRTSLEQKGQPISHADMMIAAHAIAEDAILVTNDAAFRRIDRLKVEDWTT